MPKKFKLQVGNRVVGILGPRVKSFKALEEYIDEHHPDRSYGFGRKTISQKLRDGGGVYERNGLSVRVFDVDDTKRTLPRPLRNLNEFQPIPVQNGIRITTPEIGLTEEGVNSLLSIITGKLQDLGVEFLQNHTVSIRISGNEREDRAGSTVGTALLPYNEAVDLFEDRFREAIGNYPEEGFSITSIDINWVEAPDLENIIVFGSEGKRNGENKGDTKDNTFEPSKLINDINYIPMNRSKRKKVIQYLLQKDIVKPNTHQECITVSFLMSFLQKTDVHKELNTFRKYNKDHSHTLKTILPILSKRFNTRIKVLFVRAGDNEEELSFLTFGEGQKDTTILVKGGHAYGLLDLPEGVLAKFGKQRLIKPPNATRAAKGGKEQKEKKYRIYTYDFETTDYDDLGNGKKTTEVYATGLYNGLNPIIYHKYSRDEDVLGKFIKRLRYLPDNAILYAHNGGKFDCMLLLRRLMETKGIVIPKNGFLLSNGRIINLTIYQFVSGKKKTTYFRDSYNFIVSSLDKACVDFDTKTDKLTGDVDHNAISIHNCYSKEVREKVYPYLRNDIISLYEVLHSLQDELHSHFGVNLPSVFTNASIARTVFLKDFYKPEKYPLYSLPLHIDTEIRKGYFGGRNEIFTRLGHTKGYIEYWDVTSEYPAAQASNEYPYGKVNHITFSNPITEYPEYKGKKAFGWFRVEVRHTHKRELPFLPILGKGKLLFPYYDNWTELWVPSRDVDRCLENDLGYEFRFLEMFVWENKAKMFSSVIQKMFQLKKKATVEGNMSLRSISKTTVNSQYGFLGTKFSRRDQTLIVKETAKGKKCNGSYKSADENRANKYFAYLTDGKLKDYTKIGEYDVYQLEDTIDSRCVNVAIAGMITSDARWILYEMMMRVRKVGGNLLYSDTDSIVVEGIRFDEEETIIPHLGNSLGKWTNEAADVYEDAIADLYKELIRKKNKKFNAKKVGKEFKRLYKKKVKEDMKRYPNPHFKECITLAPKMYALTTEFPYNFEGEEIMLRPKILKMKGVNSKQRYKQRIVDKEKKEIHFKDIDKISGKYKITWDDYLLINEGYTLKCDNMTFIVGMDVIIHKNLGVVKQNNCKNITKGYTKAEVDEEGNISSKCI